MTFPTIFAFSFGAIWIGIGIWCWKNEKKIEDAVKPEPGYASTEQVYKTFPPNELPIVSHKIVSRKIPTPEMEGKVTGNTGDGYTFAGGKFLADKESAEYWRGRAMEPQRLSKEDREWVREVEQKFNSEMWQRGTFLEDFIVTKTVTHEQMTIDEMVELIGKLPNVATVSQRLGATRSFFSLRTLAYPQHEKDYRLTKAQWKSLQDYCRLKLLDPIAVDSVVEHWKSIVAGTVPFGLKVEDQP